MRQFFRKSSLVSRLTSCMMNTPFDCTLIAPARPLKRLPSSTRCANLAAIPVSMVTRAAHYHQLMAAGIGTGEFAGAVILHSYSVEETGQSHGDRRHFYLSSSTMTTKARADISGLHPFDRPANISRPETDSNACHRIFSGIRRHSTGLTAGFTRI